MNTSSSLDERVLCISTAELLSATAGSAGGLALAAAVIAAAVLVLQGGWLVMPVLLLAPLERVLALRLRLDAGLFTALAHNSACSSALPTPLLSALDSALTSLKLRGPQTGTRQLTDRVAGARRLFRQHLVVVALQYGCLLLALLALGATR